MNNKKSNTKEKFIFKLDRVKFNLARAEKCYTLKDTAENADICYSTLTKILNNRMTLNVKTLGKLAKALNVKPQELIQGGEEYGRN